MNIVLRSRLARCFEGKACRETGYIWIWNCLWRFFLCCIFFFNFAINKMLLSDTLIEFDGLSHTKKIFKLIFSYLFNFFFFSSLSFSLCIYSFCCRRLSGFVLWPRPLWRWFVSLWRRLQRCWMWNPSRRMSSAWLLRTRSMHWWRMPLWTRFQRKWLFRT